MTNPTTQRRLAALLTGAIYRIADALFPIIDTIVRKPTRPFMQRVGFANRFSRIIQQLLALTARIRPETLSRNPIFPKPPARPTQPAPAAHPRQPGQIRPLTPLRPARMLTARQVAQRLAILLRQLEQLAAEIGATLPPIILRNVVRARATAGCDALSPQTLPSWERAG